MNRLIEKVDGFKKDRILYTDTDSLMIENQHIELLKEDIHDSELGKLKVEYKIKKFWTCGKK